MQLRLIFALLFSVSVVISNAQTIKDTVINTAVNGSINLYYYIPFSFDKNASPSIIAAFSQTTMQNFIPIAEKINSVIIGYYPDMGNIEQMKEVVDTIKKWVNMDSCNIYISEFSGRGSLSRSWVNAEPDYFKAFIPINAVGMDAYHANSTLASVPHCMLCGEHDRWTPYPWAPTYHDKLVLLGGISKFITVPGLGHSDNVPPEYIQACFEFLLKKPLDNEDVKAFPNPTSGILEIILDSNENTLPLNLHIYSSLGMLVYQKELTDSYLRLDLTHLGKGTYLLIIPTENEVLKKKIILY